MVGYDRAIVGSLSDKTPFRKKGIGLTDLGCVGGREDRQRKQ